MDSIQSYLRGHPPSTQIHPTAMTRPDWSRAMAPRNNGHAAPSPGTMGAMNAAIRAYGEAQLAALGPAPIPSIYTRHFAPPAAQVRPQSTTVRTGPAAHAGAEYAGSAAYFGPGVRRVAIPPSFYMPYDVG